MVLKSSLREQLTGQIIDEEDAGRVGNDGVFDDDASGSGVGADSGAGGSEDGSGGRRTGLRRGREAEGRVPFVLLLKKATDLVLQPFQALQVFAIVQVHLHVFALPRVRLYTASVPRIVHNERNMYASENALTGGPAGRSRQQSQFY